MPIPSSVTEIMTLSFVVWAYTVIDLLTGVYLNALDNKLKIIFRLYPDLSSNVLTLYLFAGGN